MQLLPAHRSYTLIAIAIVIAGVLVSASLYATVGQPTKTVTSTSASTATETTTQTATTILTVSGTTTSTYLLTTTLLQTTTSTATSTSTLTSTVTSTSTVTRNVTSVYGAPVSTIMKDNLSLPPKNIYSSMFIVPSTGLVYVIGGAHPIILKESDRTTSVNEINVSSYYGAVNPVTNTIYFNNDGCPPCTDSVVTVDASTNSIIGGINLGTYVNGIAVNAKTDTIYMTSANTDSLYIVNGTDNDLIATVPMGGEAFGVAVNSNDGLVYVPVCVAPFPGSFVCSPYYIAVMNGTTGAIISKLSIPESSMLADPTTNTVYMTSGNTLLAINSSGGIVRTTTLSAYSVNCYGLAMNTPLNQIYVACSPPNIPGGLGSFLVVDRSTGDILNSFAYNGVGGAVVFDQASQTIYLLDQNGYVLTLSLATPPILP